MKRHKRTTQLDQRGMVSLIVTMVLMIVISLVVLSFAQLARREARQSLDRQLSTEAYYAAESGINDARNYVQNGGNAITGSCASGAPFTTAINSSQNVKVTCVNIESKPTELDYDDISATKSRVIPIESDNGQLQSLTIGWQPAQNASASSLNNCPATAGAFPPQAQWACGIGVLRIDMVPVSNPIRRADLIANTFTVFLYPTTSVSGGIVYGNAVGFGKQGTVVGGYCNANSKPFCQVTISSIGGGTSYYMRIRSIYTDSSVKITGQDNSNASVRFVGAQMVVDSTGKANDVLHRIRARVPLSAQYDIPEAGIESSNDICKHFVVSSTASIDPTGLPPLFTQPGSPCSLD